MLNFCPFDFIAIDINNLAYELVISGERTWEDIRTDTVVGTDEQEFIVVGDTRRGEHFRQDNTSTIIILKEAEEGETQNGLHKFLDLIEANKNNGSMILTHTIINGIDTFVNRYKDPVMEAIPCCPYCHNRLPIGWNMAEDFAAISLMAPTTGGKTTFLYSMMNKNWLAFKNFRLNKKHLSIASAHRENDPKDSAYFQMMVNAEKMCTDYGNCPQNTDRDHWIPPVFLNIQYDGHIMIMGIYDNSGENLIAPNFSTAPQLRMLLDKMFADIYLFDPADMNITLPKAKDEEIRKQFDNCRILDIDEQGKYQTENREKSISAQDLLFIKTSNKFSFENSRLMDVYNNNYSLRHQYNCIENMNDMYFLGVIIKSDLLENADGVTSNNDYSILFDRNTTRDMLDIDLIKDRSDLVKDMIENLQLFKGKDLEDFDYDYGKGASWHCVSALGCDAILAGKLLGEYKPIRVAEPLMTCIFNRIRDNGWIR